MTATKLGNPFKVGDNVRITRSPYHRGYTGHVTKINGPKTVEVKLDAGFYLWRVKVATLEINQPVPLTTDEMIARLDAPGAMPGDPDGIDQRTVREVYDAGLLDASDVASLYKTHITKG